MEARTGIVSCTSVLALCLIAALHAGSLQAETAASIPPDPTIEPLSPAKTVVAGEVPNIIFVLVDDQRFDALGMLNPLLRTPNMDRMASEGVFFENSFVTTSLCSPSRATILTGQSTRNHGVVGNSERENSSLIYFPAYLQSRGYETALFGKWHMGGDANPRPGFDYWHSFPGQGFYTPDQRLAGPPHYNVNGQQIEQRGYITDELTDYVEQWITTQRDSDRPFFIHFAHKAVHANFSPPQRYVGLYDGVTFPTPASMANSTENYAGKPRWLKTQRNSWHGVDFAYYENRDLQDFQRRYYAALAAVDDSLGRVMNILEREGLADNTLIFVMGDNGFMFGEFGLIDKRVAYEPSMRVPFFVYGPRRLIKQGRIDEIVSNLDVAPTILELAGLEQPSQFEGQSLVGLMRGEETENDWVNEHIYEYYWDYTQPHTPTTFAIRTANFKYIYYHGVWDTEELYDLTADPLETRNLANVEAWEEKKVELRDRLFERLANRAGDRLIPYERKKGFGTQYRRIDGPPPGDFDPFFLRRPYAENPRELQQPPLPEATSD